MPAYKDEKRNTWLSLFYYEDWQGNKKKKQKRGFKTKREALEWENNFKLSANANMDMALGAFVEIYFRDKEGELKERSIKNKRYMIEAHILPYFKNKKMNEITPSDIIQWQNAMREKGYAQTYLRMVQNQITALFTHASSIYNLSNNPCRRVKKIRVHDIRHSSVAYLINQGVQPLIIKERLGHKDIKITLNTYGHLYPNQQRQVADMLNQQKTISPNSGNCQDL